MQIYDGRESFWQWDLNQKITSTEFTVGEEIHFFNMRQPVALVVNTYELDGKVVADVPNILLQSALPIRVYRYVMDGVSEQTVDEHTFDVKQRAKPADYVYTETEVLSYERLEKRIKALENGGGGNGGAPGYSPIATVMQTEEGAVIEITDLNGTTTATIKNGKDGTDGEKGNPGEKGDPGKDGSPGADGYTPKKGIDYYTNEDKVEMVQAVIAALPTYNGEVEEV